MSTKKTSYTVLRNSLPNTGTCLNSALATKEGASVNDNKNISKGEEWGAATVIGATLVGSGWPLILIQWNPNPNRKTLLTITANLWTMNLQKQDCKNSFLYWRVAATKSSYLNV